MGLYDRDYTQDNSQHRFGRAPQMRMGLPQLTPAVKWMLIINIVVYFLQIAGGDAFLKGIGAVWPASFMMVIQLWRLVTYQFLHGSVGHILFNMLGLFFLGPTLERNWGSKRFLKFYLTCGAIGGLFYILLVALGFLDAGPMIGASGAILGMLAACAILFPHFVVFFLLFPVPIRVAAIILTLLYVANLISRGANAGGDAAHLAGMAAGAFYVLSEPWWNRLMIRTRSRNWEKKKADMQKLQVELDRILEKVHQNGLQSLSGREKRTLKKATQTRQNQTKY